MNTDQGSASFPSPDTRLNSPASDLPQSCDVLIAGAGPAGSAAAITLARAGFDVVLIDQHAFPRDKICGDGLIPDAYKALQKLGVLDEVMARALPAAHVSCIGPRGGRVDVSGTLAVLPRKELDHILVRAAVRAGARMFAPVRFAAPIEDGGRVVGAQLESGAVTRELRATWTILATGAVPQALIGSGMCERDTPSGVAMRAYIKNDALAARFDKLEILWHRALSPGYGWIFPCRDGVFNIGVGVSYQHDRHGNIKPTAKKVNLRKVFDEFARVYAPAHELAVEGQWMSPLKGAPLRCTLQGAQFSRPGLIVTGEAAGSTYSFTGEGIGKAMETGMLAAQSLIAGRAQAQTEAQVREHYAAGLQELKPRFNLYAKAHNINHHPWLADFAIWRAKRSPYLMERMQGILNETSNSGEAFSLKLLKLLTR
jgi:geranylgeranyl reductase family protein